MTEFDVRPEEELHVSFSDDDMSEHSDIEIDTDLRRMSVNALKMLSSFTDEVNEISEGKSRSRSVSPSSSSYGSRHQVTPSPDRKGFSTPLKHIDDMDMGSDEDDDDDDTSDDESIIKEMNALRTVTQEIEKELRTQDAHSMKKAISQLPVENSVMDPRKRLLSTDDKQIIQRILDDEMKRYEPKNQFERLVKRYRLEGISEKEKMSILASICTVVWSIVVLLFAKVIYGEI